MKIEEESFRTSAFYWIGVLEEMANLYFVREMGGPKSIVGRWRTLSILSELDGATISELAQNTFIERSALSRLLDLMEAEGLLLRRAREGDRRTTEVHLSAHGRAAFRKMLPVRREVFQHAARGLKQEDIVAFMRTVQALSGNLAEELGQPLPKTAEESDARVSPARGAQIAAPKKNSARVRAAVKTSGK